MAATTISSETMRANLDQLGLRKLDLPNTNPNKKYIDRGTKASARRYRRSDHQDEASNTSVGELLTDKGSVIDSMKTTKAEK